MADIISVLLARKSLLLDQVELARSEFKRTISDHQQAIEQLQAQLTADRKKFNAVLGDLQQMVELGDWIDQLRLLRGDNQTPWPKFRFGERVEMETYSEERDATFIDVGVVTGMCYGYPDRKEGWWYWVKWTSLPSSDWLKVPHVESAHESELRAIAHVDDLPPPKRYRCHDNSF